MESIEKIRYIKSVTDRLHPNKDLPVTDQLYYFIHQMKIGEEFVITDPLIVKPENMDIIRNHVIWFIQNELGYYKSFDLELSQDGSKFRKISLV